MKVTEVLMTPMQAQDLLTRNDHNRPLDRHHVDFLAREMTEGRWRTNGDTICVNGSRLIDGQHRLHAIVKSGQSFPLLLVEGLPDDVFTTKDCGKRRTASNVLAIDGEKHYRRLAAAVQYVARYDAGSGKGRRVISPSEVRELLVTYGDELRQSVEFCTHLGGKHFISSTVMDGLHYIFSRSDRKCADFFWESLIGGDLLGSSSPIFVLREKLVSLAALHAKSRTRVDQAYVSALCIKAWNHLRRGTSVQLLKWVRDEPFPTAM